jgi:hypothetical protein
VDFVLYDPTRPAQPYILLASVSGTVPGQSYGNLVVPLNADAVFQGTLLGAGKRYLPDSLGLLDELGRARAGFLVPPDVMIPYLELRMDWAAVFFGAQAGVTPPVGFELVP